MIISEDNKKQFENYPFECVEDGATPEYTRCYAEKLNKYDWELRKELNDDEALFSNQKIKEVLGFKEQHNWKKYL
mgnify:CR=1 FL=1